MDPLSLLALPRRFAATAAPPLRSTTPGRARLLPSRRRRASSVSVSAVAREAPRDHEAPAPSSVAAAGGQDQFDWLDQWYPIAPVGELDPRAPHGKTVLGLSVVAWHDRTAGEWRVFEDACPHRLAPLSEGRVDGEGRLQCAYHGWCFGGAGACKFIPQAPALGPPVHENRRACVAAYPSVVQNGVLWFYPRMEPEYKDVLERKRPPFFAEIDEPSCHTVFGMRDFPYGYDIMIENLVDPAHVPYVHRGMLPSFPSKEDPGRYVPDLIRMSLLEHDQEGGDPIKMKIEQADINGFLSVMKGGSIQFEAPCALHGTNPRKMNVDGLVEPWFMFVIFCVPVSPRRSRLIWLFPRNGGDWLHKITPRWYSHMFTNRIFDSDLYLLYIEERNFAAVGLDNWHQACYVPTSDGMVIAFRNWFRRYCKNQIVWATPQVDQLPSIQAKDKLLDRYWSHVVQCRSCSAALKAMKALEITLQVASVVVIGFLAVTNGHTSVVRRTMAVSAAVLCFAASRWLSSFMKKNFHSEDYIHAYK